MTTLDDVLALYERWGWHHYDEDLAQAEHALQTAAHAEAAAAADALRAAALLHDIGHLLALDGRKPTGAHEDTGARYLSGLFPAAVVGPVALHVRAKRYLCAVEPDYLATLSTGSVRSLQRQGGPMSPAEVSDFESTPGWDGAVELRRWDDAGKADGESPRTVESYAPLLASLVIASR